MKKMLIIGGAIVGFVVVFYLLRRKQSGAGVPMVGADSTRLLSSQVAALKTTLPGVATSSGAKVTLPNGAVLTVPTIAFPKFFGR